MRRWLVLAAAATMMAGLAACCMADNAYRLLPGQGRPAGPAEVATKRVAPIEIPPLILVSIDGFRADYLDRGLTPNLAALAATGVRAERMIPSFPSLTFPNHYTLVTGLVPDHNGIVNNTFQDPALPTGMFRLSNKAAVLDQRSWDQATPIWVSAELSGIHTATEFWPGSEAPIRGVRPSHYSAYDKHVSNEQRVDQVLAWLDLPPPERPGFLTLYFDIVDTAGHDYGPDSPQLNESLVQVDAAIGRLEAGLRARNLDPNLIILADHGMAATPPRQHIYLDDFAPPGSFSIVTSEAVAGLVPSSPAAASRLVGGHPHSVCYRKADLPAHLHYGTNARIPPIVCIAEVGWLLTTRAQDARERKPLLGEHGYDPDDPRMGALFIAHGPKFMHGVVLKPFPNTDVYPLMARLLELQPEPNDGHVQDLYPALRN
jgi:predicted AlkP superfamily pyrophosphatase or phosphodiesterase